VDDLGSRINNIRNDGFLFYLRTGGRECTALLGTLFRFTQFFGWTEILYGSFGRLKFEMDKSTKAVADVLRNVGRTLATDRLDIVDPSDAMTTQLMEAYAKKFSEVDVPDVSIPIGQWPS
jgi:hypothetical protein